MSIKERLTKFGLFSRPNMRDLDDDRPLTPTEKRLSWLFPIYLIASLYYGFSTRTDEDLLRVMMVPILVFWALSIVTGIFLIFEHDTTRNKAITLFVFVFGAPIGMGSALAVYYLLLAAPIDLVYWLLEKWTWRFGSIAIIATATLIAGSALFYFRLKARCMYGLSEALAGLSIASYKFVEIGESRALTDPNFFMVVLTAGVYLVVRGFDNVQQGLTREPIDQFTLQFLHRWLGFSHKSRAKWQRAKWPARIKLGLARERLRIKPRSD
ncbi:MAG: hypothetical protein Q7T13_01595 [Polaromonas sp.]|nr:hypothetical protein [Polaromonas sp.]